MDLTDNTDKYEYMVFYSIAVFRKFLLEKLSIFNMFRPDSPLRMNLRYLRYATRRSYRTIIYQQAACPGDILKHMQ